MSHIDFNFLSNNVKRMQSSRKRLKQFEYFKNKLMPSGLLFFTRKTFDRWLRKNRKGKCGRDLHFSHGSSSSCEVLIALYGNQGIAVKKKSSNKKGRVIILDVRIDDSDFLLMNIYNANTGKEQASFLNELSTILTSITIMLYFQVILIYFLTLR